jgi:hypothetical protein
MKKIQAIDFILRGHARIHGAVGPARSQICLRHRRGASRTETSGSARRKIDCDSSAPAR